MKKSFFLIFLSEIEFYIVQASLKLADPLEFTSRVLGVHACAIAPSFSPVWRDKVQVSGFAALTPD